MQYALPLTEQTIAARLERLPYSRWHVRITIILGVAIFFDSFDSLAIAYVLPVVIRDWSIAPEKVGALLSIANFGQAVGAFAFGWIAERVGRVPAVRITIALYAVMSFACAFAQSYDQLFWFRFVEGIGLGGEIPIASSYISEILRAQRQLLPRLPDDLPGWPAWGGARRSRCCSFLRLALDVHHRRRAGSDRPRVAAFLPRVTALARMQRPLARGRRSRDPYRAHRLP
jgi:hypothetical protein